MRQLTKRSACILCLFRIFRRRRKSTMENGAAYGSPARCMKLLTPIYHRALDGNQGLRNGTAHLLQQNLSGVPYFGAHAQSPYGALNDR
ncbi:protein of unknown function [Hyphomicrobium sp. MC1]|nr:protein of unknown function [Hyphomicrobium sp. MC1]